MKTVKWRGTSLDAVRAFSEDARKQIGYQGTETESMKNRTPQNIFRDLGYEPEEAENLRIRAALMVELTEHIRRARLTQKEAAATLGVTQPRISDLMRGRINVFSIDSLSRCWRALE